MVVLSTALSHSCLGANRHRTTKSVCALSRELGSNAAVTEFNRLCEAAPLWFRCAVPVTDSSGRAASHVTA